MNFCILHKVLLVVILLFIIAIVCCHYIKHRSKCTGPLTIQKWRKLKIKKVIIKNGTRYYFDEIIKFEDFDSDNIILDEKSNENILIYDVSYKNLIGTKSFGIKFYKIDGFVTVYDGVNI